MLEHTKIYDNIHNFIIFKLKLNAGSQVGIEAPSKDDIIEFCNNHNIEIKGLTKEQLVSTIDEAKISDEILINHFRKYLGIHSKQFQEKFNIDHKTIKKLEKKGLLPINHYERARMFGDYVQVPYYDALVYFDSKENFEKLLEQL